MPWGKGMGKTYGDDVAAALKKVWREAGCPCLPYFKADASVLCCQINGRTLRRCCSGHGGYPQCRK